MRSAYDVQRDFGLSSGLRSEIIWDCLAADQVDVLKQKIENLICANEARSPKVVAKQREQLFKNVWQQRKYTSGNLLSAIIYVLVTPETDPEQALQSTNYTCHPVFRTRKCLNSANNSDGCCMVFVDEHGRIYGNWAKYVSSNTLPKGTMIAPSQGIYTLIDDNGNDSGVHLMVHPTPLSKAKYRILNVGDTMATVGGLMASVPVAAATALAVPVAAPILLVAGAVGVATTAYSTARSATRLIDRRYHGQSTSVRDSEARSSWLGVAGGVVGLGATGATTVLSTVAKGGRDVNSVAQLAVKGINVSSIVISGTGVVNGVYELYSKISDEQPLSSFDVLQLASSLVTFTHSINNLRIASKATNGSSLRKALRSQTRKVIDQISQESVKLQNGDSTPKKFDIVRTLNDIPFKETLLSLHKINSHLRDGASVASALGATLLPSIVKIGAGGSTRLNMDELAERFGCKFVQHITNAGTFMDVLDALTKYFSEKAVQLLLQMTKTFIDQNVDGIDRALNTFLSTEMILYRLLMYCVNTYEDFTAEFLERHRQEILKIIKKYFQSLETVGSESSRKIKCSACQGFYVMSQF